jgi:hypothetical protein
MGLEGAVGEARFNSPKNGKSRSADMTPQLTKVLAPLVNNQAMHQWLWLYRDGPTSPVRFTIGYGSRSCGPAI